MMMKENIKIEKIPIDTKREDITRRKCFYPKKIVALEIKVMIMHLMLTKNKFIS